MFKNKPFLVSIFNWFFSVLAFQREAKIKLCSHLYRKCRFCKNHCFSSGKLLFFWFGASKNRTKIDTKTQLKITSKKNSKILNFSVHFDFRKPPKSLRKATLNEACFATLWKSRGSRRKSTEPGVCKASKWLGIWLGLLDLPLVALIIEVNPSTWNVSLILVPSKI